MGSNAGSRRTLAGLKQRLQDAPRRTVVPFPCSDLHQHTAGDIMRALDEESGDFGRVDVVRFLAPTTRLTVAETCLVLAEFAGDTGRLHALEALRCAIVDRRNWHILASEFTAAASRRAARALMPGTDGDSVSQARDGDGIEQQIERTFDDLARSVVAGLATTHAPASTQTHTGIAAPAPSAVATEVDGNADELREEIKMQRELVALEREATELARERARLESPWWVRLLRWVFRIDRRRT